MRETLPWQQDLYLAYQTDPNPFSHVTFLQHTKKVSNENFGNFDEKQTHWSQQDNHHKDHTIPKIC